MEGRTVVISVLIMTLFMAQSQVESKICCPSVKAINIFKVCSLSVPRSFCLKTSGCISQSSCPPGYPYVENYAQGDAVNEYCKLGCTFSVCGAMNTLQNTDTNEIVNGAVEQCTKACSTICNKGSLAAVKSA